MPEQPPSFTDWLEAVGTVGSLFVALSILMLDRRNRKREQAKGIHFWVEVTDQEYAKIRNLSSAPIAMPRVYFRPWTIPEQIWFWIRHPVRTVRRLRGGRRFFRSRSVGTWQWGFERGEDPAAQYVEPGEVLTSPIPPGITGVDQRMHIVFKDAASNYWAIDDEGHRIRGGPLGFAREMRLGQKFLWMQTARQMGISVRDLMRRLDSREKADTDDVQSA
ncbi:hypothetical protein [Promicromonospora sp. NFX87]|uniref:hypothetical protein n=1 Tax=Promicromonospora sp. NFX87 TaxID=3402691 RepID=UPI003AFA4806